MEMQAARWVVWITILLILLVTAFYVVKVFRDWAYGGEPSPKDQWEQLRKLREIGALDDAQYKRARQALPQSAAEPIKFEESPDDSDGKVNDNIVADRKIVDGKIVDGKVVDQSSGRSSDSSAI